MIDGQKIESPIAIEIDRGEREGRSASGIIRGGRENAVSMTSDPETNQDGDVVAVEIRCSKIEYTVAVKIAGNDAEGTGSSCICSGRRKRPVSRPEIDTDVASRRSSGVSGAVRDGQVRDGIAVEITRCDSVRIRGRCESPLGPKIESGLQLASAKVTSAEFENNAMEHATSKASMFIVAGPRARAIQLNTQAYQIVRHARSANCTSMVPLRYAA